MNNKLKLFCVLVAMTIIYFIGTVTPVLAASLQSDPVPQLPAGQRDKYQTDLFTGSASYSYPIKVPKGTDDLTPDVSVSYNSSGARDLNTSVGIGWQLNQNYISRDVNFTPTDTSDDKFKLHLNGASYDLVYNSSDSLFHTKIESHLKIQQFLNGGQNTTGMYWQVTDTTGTVYRFGYANNAELVCNGRSYDSLWNIDQVQDIHNNKIYYAYTQSNGLSYPSQIKYNNDQQREVDFTYTSNAYQHPAYQQGCNVNDASLLVTIQVKTSGTIVHQYDMNFSAAGNDQLTLAAITEKGKDGSALPPTTFNYKPELKTWNTTPETWLDHQDVDVTLDKLDVTTADVNGDGLPDIVKSEGSGINTWKVLLNTGSGWSSTFQIWLNNANIDARLDKSDTALIDVTGDGLPDIVKGGDPSQWRVWRNTGSSWSTTQENWGNITAYSNAHLGGTNNDTAMLVDVTGDGLPDIVNTWWNGAVDWRIFRNTGNGWNTTPETWSHGGAGVGLDDPSVRVMDVNGDGLADIVKTTYSGDTNTSTDTWLVYKNTGSSWSTTPETWVNNAPINAYLGNSHIVVTDVNGDGLPDILRSVDGGLSDTFLVYKNTGNGWSTQADTWIPSSANVDLDFNGTNTKIVDTNGDGLPDIVKGTNDCSCGFDTWKVWKNNGISSDLLSDVHTSQGGTISFDYTPSTKYPNVGTDSLSDLPFPLWIVSKMTVDNGMTNSQNTHDITTYSYKNGSYNWQQKEFRGFGEVDETDPNGSKKQTLFKQDDGLKGTMYQQQTTDAQGNLYAETDNIWASSLSNGIYTNTLTTEKNYTYDSAASNPKIIEADYQYDQYGNVTKKLDLGDTTTNTDDRFIYNEYTYNTTAWILNTVKHSYSNASDDATKVSESWFYYDGNPLWISSPTKGDLTKEEKWLNGGTNPITQYSYDGYGNQISVTDANNHTTTTAYDNATGTYPVTTTNAKNQTTTATYDLGTGNVLTKTDPNGLTTTYIYDVFGRILKEIKPYDTNDYPSTIYTYLVDGIAPEGMLVSKRQVSSSSAMLNTFVFQDGLGRTIQTRADAEDTTKQIVKDTFYDPSGNIAKETVPYSADSTLSGMSPQSASPSATKFGDGSSGDLSVTSNITDSPIDSSVTASANSTTATVGSGVAFSSNQIVLLHQTQGTNAGIWEFARVAAYSGTTLTFTQPLVNAYSSSGSNHAQVRVVPQYYNVTVSSGATWTAKPWNGSTGGILAFFAKGTITNNGTIYASGKGFRGATGVIGHNGTYSANYGEGNIGPVGNNGSYSANGTAGGGGFQNSSNYTAGGGASYGTVGTSGNNNSSSTGGAPGNVYGSTDLTTMILGSGGGAGLGNQSGGVNDVGGNGGNGGGILMFIGATLSNNGTFMVAGSDGGTGQTGGDSAGGGAGSGGSVLINAQSAMLGTINGLGGAGGHASGNSSVNGGSGGSGRIRVVYESSITGTTIPAASTVQAQIPLVPAGIVPLTLPISVSGIYVSPAQNTKYVSYTYDPLGRVTIVTNPDSTIATTAYDHWKQTTIDENGHIKRQYQNAFGKITKVEEVNNATTYTTTYEYDSRDLLTKITDHTGNITSVTYDSLGNKLSQTSPDAGTWHYAYDGVGNVTTVTDNRGIATTNTYDALDRLIKKDYPTDTDTTFAYDIGKIGTLSIATDSAGTVNYAYDNRLRKTQEQRSVNGTTKTTQFSYDAADRMTTRTNPDGEVVSYAFNPQGQINSVSGSTNIVNNIDYNAQNKITKKDFANGLSTNYTYNTSDFRLNRIQTGTLQDMNYTYDNVGNVKTIADAITNKTQSFGYDDLDRLTTASESGGFNYQYQYNPIGNLTKSINAGVSTDYLYGQNAGPHALTSASGSAITQASSSATEILGTTWTLAGSNGSAEQNKSIASNTISGATSIQVTFNLHGTSFGSGDDEASVVFVQNGDWRAANVIVNGGQNGLNGSQTITIPVSSFHKVGVAGTVLDPNQPVSDLHARFWNSGTFSVDVTSVKVNSTTGGGGGGTPAVPQMKQGTDGTATTASTATVPFSSTVTAGNMILAVITQHSGSVTSVTDSQGDTFTAVTTAQHANASNDYTELYYAKNVHGGATSVTANFSTSTKLVLGIYEYSGLDQTAPLDQVAATTGNSSTPNGGTITTTLDNELYFVVGVDDYTGNTGYTAGSGYTVLNEVDDGTNNERIVNESRISAHGSYTTNYTISTTAHWAVIGASFKPATSSTQAPTNLALNKPVTTSSVENNDATLVGSKAVDGSTSTRWSSNFSDPQWLYVDLGTPTAINHVKLTWETAYGSGYQIQVSNDASNWTTIYSTTTGDGGVDDLTNLSGTGRYVRIYGTTRATQWGYSLYEFEVYGPASSNGLTTYAYDANGNMTSDGLHCYHYNDANQMDKVTNCSTTQTIAEYVYDYNGNRMVKKNYTNGTLSNTVTSWSDSYETKVIVGGATENTTYYFANGQLLAKKNPDGSRYYIHSDHLGSTSVVTDQSGNVVESTKYDPWGEVLAGGTKAKFLYTGQEKDSETNLNYYNARYYDSHIRRFTQPDDVVEDIYNPQELNVYSYVQNNPLKYTDPTGHTITVQNGRIVDTTGIFLPPPPKAKPTTYAAFITAISKPQSSSAKSSGSSGSKVAGAAVNNSQSQNRSVPQSPPGVDINANIRQAQLANVFLPPVAKELWFKSMVNTGGPWDYKKNGHKEYDPFGNFNYGATGTALGYPPIFLQSMAGVAEIWDNSKLNPSERAPTAGTPFIQYPYHDTSYDGKTSPSQTEIVGGINYYYNYNWLLH